MISCKQPIKFALFQKQERKGSNLDLTYKESNYRKFDYHKKLMHLPREKFLRRFLLHVRPKGFMCIRHYGYLANRVRVKQLEKIRKCLKVTKAIVVQPAKSGYSPAAQAGTTTILTQGHLIF